MSDDTQRHCLRYQTLGAALDEAAGCQVVAGEREEVAALLCPACEHRDDSTTEPRSGA